MLMTPSRLPAIRCTARSRGRATGRAARRWTAGRALNRARRIHGGAGERGA